MQKERASAKKGLAAKLLRAAVVLVAVYLLFTFVSGQMQVSSKQRELNEVNARLELQMQENAELQQLMASGDEDAYVERMAREKLYYARPEERIFIDLTGE